MPFDSTGNFTRVHNWETDRLNDVDIVSDRHDEEDDNFAEGISACVCKDGRSVMTGNLNVGGYRVINISSAQATTDAVNKSQLDSVDSAAVHLTGAETITGNKTFSGTTGLATTTVTTLTVSTTLNIPGGSIWIA